MVAELSVRSDAFFIKRIAKRKKRVEKIELELIMSDFAIGYLGALIFFANMKYFMVTVHTAGTFVFIFLFPPFEISLKYAFIRQILHVPGW